MRHDEGIEFLKLLPADLGGPEKAGMLDTPWSSWSLHFAVQALRNCPVPLRQGKMLISLKIPLRLERWLST